MNMPHEILPEAASGPTAAAFALICRIGVARLCAVPLDHVLETMRPQPVQPLSGAPDHVLGVALVRGVAQPVVDLARLLDANAQHTAVARWVTLRVGERRVALAVAEVLEVRPMPAAAAQTLPPLLRHAAGAAVAALSAMDAQLVLVLDSARLLPEPEPQAPAEPLAEPSAEMPTEQMSS